MRGFCVGLAMAAVSMAEGVWAADPPSDPSQAELWQDYANPFDGYLRDRQIGRLPDDGIDPAISTTSEIAAAASESVGEAIRAALAYDPALRVAEAGIAQASAARLRAAGQFLPDVEASLTYTDESWQRASVPAAAIANRGGTTLEITARQPLFQGFSTFNRFRAERSRYAAAEWLYEAERLSTALEAASAHAEVVFATEILRHRQSNLALVRQQQTIAEKRQAAGAQSRTGVEQARLRVAQAEIDLAAARAELARRQARYTRLTGRSRDANFAPDMIKPLDEGATLETVFAHVRGQNPFVQAAEAGWEGAKYGVAAARGSFAPSVTLEGSYLQYQDDLDPGLGLAGVGDEDLRVVARLTLPIGSQNNNRAALRSAKAQLASEKAQARTVLLEAEERAVQFWHQRAEAALRREAAAAGVKAAADAVRGLQLEYSAGQRTVIDVLDSQRDLVQAEIAASRADLDYRLSHYELAAVTGALIDLYTAP